MDNEKKKLYAELADTKYENSEIIQANELIESRKSLDILENRLFCLGVMELYPQLKEGCGQTEFGEVKIPMADIIRLFGNHCEYYSRLKMIARRLQGRLVHVKDGDTDKDGWTSLNIFRRMEFDKKKGGLIIRFSEDMKPYLLELANRPYTKVAGKVVFALNSRYAVRIIELMMELQNINHFKTAHEIKRYLTVKELRTFLHIENKYKNISDFTKNVIQAATNDINKSTNYILKYSVRKEARKVAGYDFTLTIPAMPEMENAETIQDLLDAKNIAKVKKAGAEEATIENEEADIRKILIHYGVGRVVANKLSKNYSREYIIGNIRYALSQKRIRNVGAYIVKAIRDDYMGTRGLSDEDYERPLSIKEQDELYKADLKKFLAEYGITYPMAEMLMDDSRQNENRHNQTLIRLAHEKGFRLEDLIVAAQKRILPASPYIEAEPENENIRVEEEQEEYEIIDDEVEARCEAKLRIFPKDTALQNKLGNSMYNSVMSATMDGIVLTALAKDLIIGKGYNPDDIMAEARELLKQSGIIDENNNKLVDVNIDSKNKNNLSEKDNSSTENNTENSANIKYERLMKIVELKERNMLSEEEFIKAKMTILEL